MASKQNALRGKRLPALAAVFALLLALVLPAGAAEQLEASPAPSLEYGETSEVTVGTIRYINQRVDTEYFYESYWGAYTAQAYEQCGTSSMSMALSYIGINATPGALADSWGANGGAFGAHFNTPPAGAEVTGGAFYQAFANYLNGNGQYSPVVIHLDSYSASGHFVVVAGQVSDSEYLIVDPAKPTPWVMTIVDNGDGTLTLTYEKSGGTVSETTTDEALRCIQYYNGEAQLHQTPFTDIYGTQIEDAVNAVTTAGLFSGVSEDSFAPTQIMTRRQAAVVLYRLAGTPELEQTTSPLSDVAAEDDARPALLWCAETGVLPTDAQGRLRPDRAITRQELAAMLYRYETLVAGNETKSHLTALTDYVDRNLLHSDSILSMQWAVGAGLMASTSDTVMRLSPNASVTRGSAAVILASYLALHQ